MAIEENQQSKVDWWKYKIDDDIIKRIKSNDKDAIRQFYLDNEQLIRNIAIHFFYRVDGIREYVIRRQYRLDDMINQIYVDIPLYNYANSKKLYAGMCRSCRYIDVGGYSRGCFYWLNEDKFVLSLDKNLVSNGNIFTLYDVLASSCTCEKEVIDKVPLREWLKFEKILEKMAITLYPNDKYMQEKFIRSV